MNSAIILETDSESDVDSDTDSLEMRETDDGFLSKVEVGLLSDESSGSEENFDSIEADEILDDISDTEDVDSVVGVDAESINGSDSDNSRRNDKSGDAESGTDDTDSDRDFDGSCDDRDDDDACSDGDSDDHCSDGDSDDPCDDKNSDDVRSNLEHSNSDSESVTESCSESSVQFLRQKSRKRRAIYSSDEEDVSPKIVKQGDDFWQSLGVPVQPWEKVQEVDSWIISSVRSVPQIELVDLTKPDSVDPTKPELIDLTEEEESHSTPIAKCLKDVVDEWNGAMLEQNKRFRMPKKDRTFLSKWTKIEANGFRRQNPKDIDAEYAKYIETAKKQNRLEKTDYFRYKRFMEKNLKALDYNKN